MCGFCWRRLDSWKAKKDYFKRSEEIFDSIGKIILMETCSQWSKLLMFSDTYWINLLKICF